MTRNKQKQISALRKAERVISSAFGQQVSISELELGEPLMTHKDWRFQLITDVISEEIGQDVLAKDRDRDKIDGRRIACAILVRNFGYTTILTAKLLGGYHHSTVIHHLSNHDSFMLNERKYRELYDRISQEVEHRLKTRTHDYTRQNQTLRRTEDGSFELRGAQHASRPAHHPTRTHARSIGRILNEDQESFIKSITHEQIN
ncbi:MAG: hypothetical protein H6606_05920 [Flavobacteriales bacterium]|nr:hypothetical protein [Flavobacteriales bacterium]